MEAVQIQRLRKHKDTAMADKYKQALKRIKKVKTGIKTTLILTFFFIFIFLGIQYSISQEQNLRLSAKPGDISKIPGCWKGGRVDKFAGRDEQWRLISLKPDGSLALTFIVESGTRSRIWDYDIPITRKGSILTWLAHNAKLNSTENTMTVIKEWKGVRTDWRFVRDKTSDEFLRKMKLSIGGQYKYKVPKTTGDGWMCADMTEAGFDRDKIVKFVGRIIEGKHGDIHNIIIVKDGKLVLEEYFSTNGKSYGPFHKNFYRNKPHHLASTTKAILSILTGIAIDKGFLPGVEVPIYSYLPKYSHLFSGDKNKIRIKHMLTMTAGFQWEQFKYRWQDPRNDGAQMNFSNDVLHFVLSKPLSNEPGLIFNYSNGVPTVMGAVLKNACAVDVDVFAEKYLFQPLGISDYVWHRYKDKSIETDGGLALRSRDMAKIGQLFLQFGQWKGQRIISQDWIKKSTQPRIKLKGSFWGWKYGYYWMQVDLNINKRKIHSYFVPGDGGQLLSVFPDLNMVIVFTAGNYGTNVKSTCFNIIYYYILPALERKGTVKK
jgi:CubicO group peptidase (beta-lactamase class C family)